MELFKSEYSDNKGNGKLDKVLLKCEESNYYELIFCQIIHRDI